MKKWITAFMIIALLNTFPSAMAIKPEPTGAGLIPSIVIANGNFSNLSDDSKHTAYSIQASFTVANTSQKKNPRIVSSVITLNNTYETIVMNRLVGLEAGAGQLLASLPATYSKVLLYLPRAEQGRIIMMDQNKAKESLAGYRLANQTGYSKRVISTDIIQDTTAKAVASKAKYESLVEEVSSQKSTMRNEGVALENSRRYLLANADLIINSLERIKFNIQINNDLTDIEAEDMTADIEAAVDRMKEVRAQITGAEDRTELASAIQAMQEAWDTTAPQIKDKSLSLMQARLWNVVESDGVQEQKVECSLNALEKNGKNVTLLDRKMDTFSIKVMKAKDGLMAAKKSISQSNSSTSAVDLTRSADQDLKDAQSMVKEIVKEIKSMGGDIIDCGSNVRVVSSS
jgi:hypothetical protein